MFGKKKRKKVRIPVMTLLLCITNASGLSLWSMLGGGIIAFVPTLAMTIR